MQSLMSSPTFDIQSGYCVDGNLNIDPTDHIQGECFRMHAKCRTYSSIFEVYVVECRAEYRSTARK